jgi:aminoglycoside phosphotransferase family enzyme/predicted kinase
MSVLKESGQTRSTTVLAAAGEPYAEVRETHSAVVFLVGDHAYKLKKPVDLGFLDFSTRERRLNACRREVELNRRLAPDVYLGVDDVTDASHRALDHLVVMRRLPADRRLSSLVTGDGDVTTGLRAAAHALAAFHSCAAQGPRIAAEGDRDALACRWEANLSEVKDFVGGVLDEEVVGRVELLVHRFLAGRAPLFSQRIQRGAVVDGHGDLLAEDIFLLDDGPRILDCLDFDDRLRFLDQVDDIACLAMDLERLGREDLAAWFVAEYLSLRGDNAPTSLVHHYTAYRAFMRAKVTCLRGPEHAGDARHLLRLADSHLAAGRVRLVLVGGGPGTGKSTTAAGLADALACTVLSSDRIRKELAGVAPESSQRAAFEQGIYSQEWTDRTYDEMLRRAQTLVGLGESVVLDATWSSAAHRELAVGLAERTTTDLTQLECSLPLTLIQQRIAGRATERGISDADPHTAATVLAGFDPWHDAHRPTTRQEPARVVAEALSIINPTRSSPMPLPRMAAD